MAGVSLAVGWRGGSRHRRADRAARQEATPSLFIACRASSATAFCQAWSTAPCGHGISWSGLSSRRATARNAYLQMAMTVHRFRRPRSGLQGMARIARFYAA